PIWPSRSGSRRTCRRTTPAALTRWRCIDDPAVSVRCEGESTLSSLAVCRRLTCRRALTKCERDRRDYISNDQRRSHEHPMCHMDLLVRQIVIELAALCIYSFSLLCFFCRRKISNKCRLCSTRLLEPL